MDFRKISRQLGSLELGVYAANASFFILLSLFPAMMLLIGIVQYTPLTPDDLQAPLTELVPGALSPLLDYMTQELFAESSGAMLPISAIVALWTASKGVYSLLRALNRVYRLRESRNYFLLRLRCTAFTVVLMVALLLTAALQLFGQHLAETLGSSEFLPLRILAALLRMKYWRLSGMMGQNMILRIQSQAGWWITSFILMTMRSVFPIRCILHILL